MWMGQKRSCKLLKQKNSRQRVFPPSKQFLVCLRPATPARVGRGPFLGEGGIGPRDYWNYSTGELRCQTTNAIIACYPCSTGEVKTGIAARRRCTAYRHDRHVNYSRFRHRLQSPGLPSYPGAGGSTPARRCLAAPGLSWRAKRANGHEAVADRASGTRPDSAPASKKHGRHVFARHHPHVQ